MSAPAYKVLVVDDEPPLARALAINLRAHGWEVVTAHDGRSALDVLNQLERSRPGIRERAIVITGSLTRELPADLPPILLKPFSRAELEEALVSRVGRRHPTDGSATAESPVVDPIEPIVQ